MRVWNITNLTGDPKFIVISGKRCSPGKSVEVDSITKKERALEGSYIYVGDLLPEVAVSGLDPLTKAECKSYLKSKSKEDLLALTKFISPSVGKDLENKSEFWLRSKIVNAIFSELFEVSPSAFLWTNLWERSGSGYRRV